MSAISLAQKTLSPTKGGHTMAFLEKLTELGFLNQTIEELSVHEGLVEFFKEDRQTQKKVSPSPEERRGEYNEEKCDARIWKPKPRSGGLGYDNIQCSSKKVDGCLCKKHAKMQEEGKLWTGLITEPRPEDPKKPDGTPMFWCTDKDGNDIVKEKKEKKEKKGKKEKKERKTKKVKKDVDYTEEELLALLAKKKMEKEQEKLVKEKEQEKLVKEKEQEKLECKPCKEQPAEQEEEEKEKGAGTVPTDDEESDEEADIYESITVDGTEYQLNKDDKTVIRIDDFAPVGVWNTETESIDFDDEDDE